MISTILVPAMVVQTLLTPVLGPLGDRLSRKWLILTSDVVRGIAIAVLAATALRGSFAVPVILWRLCPLRGGIRAFQLGSHEHCPALVPADALQGAVRMSQSVHAIGRVAEELSQGCL